MWRWHDHFVARLAAGEDGHGARLLGTVGHHDLVLGVLQSLVALQLRADAPSELRRASVGRIPRLSTTYGLHACFCNDVRRVEVRFACGKSDHVDPVVLHGTCEVRQRHRPRRTQRRHAWIDAAIHLRRRRRRSHVDARPRRHRGTKDVRHRPTASIFSEATWTWRRRVRRIGKRADAKDGTQRIRSAAKEAELAGEVPTRVRGAVATASERQLRHHGEHLQPRMCT
mmetsp:Transcript_6957/g.42551  ORF Transcript_6957/g.42551 Transcript_6957/m.42551 type:complete len:227 (+) Transcript_6957:1893-2573(+)